MAWFHSIDDPRGAADGLPIAHLAGSTDAAEGIEALMEALRLAGDPAGLALWVDGEFVGVCAAADLREEAEDPYRYGGSDNASVPGGGRPRMFRYMCPEPDCGRKAYVPLRRFALCYNHDPAVAMREAPA